MDNRVFTILGDGEIAEGQIWKLPSTPRITSSTALPLFVDWNKRQVDGYVEDIMDAGDIAEKILRRSAGMHYS